MIPRYSRPEMVAIWSPETRFRIWLDVELAACEAMVRLGEVPPADLEEASVDGERGVLADGRLTRHLERGGDLLKRLHLKTPRPLPASGVEASRHGWAPGGHRSGRARRGCGGKRPTGR